jgi:hypothetical protein
MRLVEVLNKSDRPLGLARFLYMLRDSTERFLMVRHRSQSFRGKFILNINHQQRLHFHFLLCVCFGAPLKNARATLI